jgi:hypothetical protein
MSPNRSRRLSLNSSAERTVPLNLSGMTVSHDPVSLARSIRRAAIWLAAASIPERRTSSSPSLITRRSRRRFPPAERGGRCRRSPLRSDRRGRRCRGRLATDKSTPFGGTLGAPSATAPTVGSGIADAFENAVLTAWTAPSMPAGRPAQRLRLPHAVVA